MILYILPPLFFLATIMLSYQHAYHAGSFADVIKHLTLTHLIQHLTKKETPLLYLETHSGRGEYDLTNAMSKKTNEFKTGILPIWKQRAQLPGAFRAYLEIIQSLNASGKLVRYPGSPLLAASMLRLQDRLYLCEMHPQEFTALKTYLGRGKRLHLANQNGWEALNALLPPPEKRALIMMDPSFEMKQDYIEIPKRIHAAYQRFPQGVYCLWYPITIHQHHLQMTKKLASGAFSNPFQLEFFLKPQKQTSHLHGMGLWIINAPYTLSQTLTPALQVCKQLFNPPYSDFFINKR